ncbi:MAG TPA: hypothetical protein ENK43_02910 [Planctomycetes bacterium]|nr:hypothetical protein [Planctomycetota bacterium]
MTVRSWFVLSALLCMPFAWSGPAVDGTVVAEPSIFPHGRHVPEEWYEGKAEVARDCRGCHDWPKKSGAGRSLEPESTCKLCHVSVETGPAKGTPSLSTSPTTLAGIREAARKFPSFRHEDHLVDGMECRACHWDPSYEHLPASQRELDTIWVPAGFGTCLECHDPAKRTGRFARFNDLAQKDGAGKRFRDALNSMASMEHGAGDPLKFRHEDHLEKGGLSDPKACETCHAATKEATAELGANTFGVSSCAECHRDATQRGLQVSTSMRRLESGADLSFHHVDHQDKRAFEKSKILRDKGCMACHAYLPGSSTGDYPVRQDLKLDTFAGCSDCHRKEDVQGKKSGAAFHELKDHGDIGSKPQDANGCVACHDPNRLVPWDVNRREDVVDRRRPAEFVITRQAHPHITGEAPQGKCVDCHLSRIPAIRSRIQKKRFSHGSHLPKEGASFQDCLLCHGAADGSPAARMEFPLGDSVTTYRTDVCMNCHKGVKGEEIETPSFVKDRRPVVRFDHKDHVSLNEVKPDANACTVCHETVEAPGAENREFAYAKDVKDCRACHDHHKPDWAERTGGGPKHPHVNGPYVDACVECHEVHDGHIPVPDKKYEFPMSMVTGLAGRQFHPDPAEKKCSACHVVAPMGLRTDYPIAGSYRRVGYQTKKDFHRKIMKTRQPCFACHWADPKLGDKQAMRRAERLSLRQREGNDLNGFPGLRR